MRPSLALAFPFLSLVSAYTVQEANTTALSFNTSSITAPEPIEFSACKGFSLENNTFDIAEVTLDPNPPRKKQDVKIVVRGHLNETIEQGAYVKVTLKKGILKHTLDFDFCKGIVSGCPVAAGDIEFWTGQYISNIVPKGKAKVMVKPFTKDGKVMGCVEVPVKLVKA